MNTISEEGEQPFTIQKITMNYVKPGKPGSLTSSAQVRKGGQQVTIVEV